MTDDVRPTDAELAELVETGTGRLDLDLARRLAAEALGTGLLIVAVIGSGIAASRLSSNDSRISPVTPIRRSARWKTPRNCPSWRP